MGGRVSGCDSLGRCPRRSTPRGPVCRRHHAGAPEPLVGGLARPVSTIEHPLLAKGIVLQDAGGTYVLCSLDLCLLSNRSHAHLRQRLAEAAGTAPLRVALHEVQQHTAPGIDLDVQRLLDAEKQARRPARPGISTG